MCKSTPLSCFCSDLGKGCSATQRYWAHQEPFGRKKKDCLWWAVDNSFSWCFLAGQEQYRPAIPLGVASLVALLLFFNKLIVCWCTEPSRRGTAAVAADMGFLTCLGVLGLIFALPNPAGRNEGCVCSQTGTGIELEWMCCFFFCLLPFKCIHVRSDPLSPCHDGNLRRPHLPGDAVRAVGDASPTDVQKTYGMGHVVAPLCDSCHRHYSAPDAEHCNMLLGMSAHRSRVHRGVANSLS